MPLGHFLVCAPDSIVRPIASSIPFSFVLLPVDHSDLAHRKQRSHLDAGPASAGSVVLSAIALDFASVAPSTLESASSHSAQTYNKAIPYYFQKPKDFIIKFEI